MRRKIAPFRTEIIDGLARRSRPAPPPVDELSKLRSLAASHDRRYVGDLDIFARFDVRHAFGHVEVDFQILEILGDRSDVDLEPVIIAHRRPSLGSCDSCSFPLCSTYDARANPFRSRCAGRRRDDARSPQARRYEQDRTGRSDMGYRARTEERRAGKEGVRTGRT